MKRQLHVRVLVSILAVLLVSCAMELAPAPSGITTDQDHSYPAPSTVAVESAPTPQPNQNVRRRRVVPTPLPQRPMPDRPASNFAFRVQSGGCSDHIRIVDLFTNTLTQHTSVGPPHTIPFTITAADRLHLYRKMVEINFFSYPPHFTVPRPADATTAGTTPYMSYDVAVRHDDLTLSVHWDDQFSSPTSTEADNFRSLIWHVDQIVERYPEVQQLPARGGCA